MSSGKRRTGEVRMQLAREMRAKYYAGATIRSLAAEYDCAFGTVRNNLLLVDTQLRKRGGALPRPIVVEAEQPGSVG